METKKLLSLALGAMMLCSGMKAEVDNGLIGVGGLGYLVGSACLGGCTLYGVLQQSKDEMQYQHEKESRKLADEKVTKGEWVTKQESSNNILRQRPYDKTLYGKKDDVEKATSCLSSENVGTVEFYSNKRWYSAPISVLTGMAFVAAGTSFSVGSYLLYSFYER